MVVVMVMVLGVPMVAGMMTLQGQGEGVMSNVPMLKTRVEGRVCGGMDISFTSGDCKRLQYMKDNLALW